MDQKSAGVDARASFGAGCRGGGLMNVVRGESSFAVVVPADDQKDRAIYFSATKNNIGHLDLIVSQASASRPMIVSPYRCPETGISFNIFSNLSSSSLVSSTIAAPTFSAKYSTLFVPGIV